MGPNQIKSLGEPSRHSRAMDGLGNLREKDHVPVHNRPDKIQLNIEIFLYKFKGIKFLVSVKKKKNGS
jgi:hypothetical protein